MNVESLSSCLGVSCSWAFKHPLVKLLCLRKNPTLMMAALHMPQTLESFKIGEAHGSLTLWM